MVDEIFMTEKSEYDKESSLEIAYCTLHQAYQSSDRDKMINAYISMNRLGQPFFNNRILPAIKSAFIANGEIFPQTVNIYDILDINQLRLNLIGCMQAVQVEIAQRQFYVSNHRYAQQVLYNRGKRPFSYGEILYTKKDNILKVSDFLKVLHYSISIAQAFEPQNENYEYAHTALTVLQAIDATLNNKPEDKPINKMLHLATSFLSSVVKSSLSNVQDKRNVMITSTMLDLAIDFCVSK